MSDQRARDRLQALTRFHHPELEEDETDDLGICGWLHGLRERSIMLELRFKNGNVLALGYAWLEKVNFDPSEGFVLHFVNHKVHLRGNHLQQPIRGQSKLLDGLLRQRIPWIQESSLPEVATSDKHIPIITEICVK